MHFIKEIISFSFIKPFRRKRDTLNEEITVKPNRQKPMLDILQASAFMLYVEQRVG